MKTRKIDNEEIKAIDLSSQTGNLISLDSSGNSEDLIYIGDTTVDNGDLLSKLRKYREKNKQRLIFATLNLNSIRYKFEELKLLVLDNIDVLVVNETKLDSTFPVNQFKITGFNMYRIDRTDSGGGTIIYVRDDISCKELDKHTFPSDVEGIFVELNLKKYKILLLGTYSPPSQNKTYFLNSLSNSLDLYMNEYEKLVLLGDFNMNVRTSTEPIFADFLDQYEVKNLVKEPTCFKSLENPSTIDLVITNFSKSFCHTRTFDNCLSDFHRLVTTVLKFSYEKPKPKLVNYRDFKNFNLSLFQNDLFSVFKSGCNDYSTFETMYISTLNLHAPLKQKTIRANHGPFMNKSVRKAIMKRNQLYNKWTKTRQTADRENFLTQKKIAAKTLKKAKQHYFHNLKDKDVLDNKKFWKIIKSSFTDKTKNRQTINLVEDGQLINDDQKKAEIFKEFYSKAVENLDIKENAFIVDRSNDSNINRSY